MTQTLPDPITAEMVTPAYVPVIAYTGGADGDDIDTATANSTDDYAPRTQAAKAALMVPAGELAVDIGKDYGPYARGDIEPHQPYPVFVPEEVP